MRRLSYLVLVLAGVAGCIPIAPAHKRVEVPALEVEVQWAPTNPTPDTTVELMRGRDWSVSVGETFVAIVRDTVDSRWVEVHAASGARAKVEFSPESRYIGVPAISFLPEDRNFGKEHTLFLRLHPADDDLYRIVIEGRKAVVEKTALSYARQRVTPAMGPVHHQDFYRSVPWSASDRLVVLDFRRGEARDVLSVRVKDKSDR